MSILWCAEQWRGRTGSRDDRGMREYTRHFQVMTDSIYTAQLVVREAIAFGLPAMFDSYTSYGGTEFDLYALVRRISSRQDEENGFLWHVEVQYSTQTDDPDRSVDPATGQPIDNPLLEPQEVEWSFQQFQRPLERDLIGHPLTSTAHGKFDPPIMIDDSRVVLRVTWNQPSFNVALAMAYQDAINSDWFWGAAPGTAKVASLRGSKQVKYGLVYWQNTYEIHFAREGWNQPVLDRDFHFLDEASPRKRIRAADNNGRASGDPILLNGNGMPLAYLNSQWPGSQCKLAAAIGTTDTTLSLDLTGTVINVFPVKPTDGTILTPTRTFDIMIGLDLKKEIMRVTACDPTAPSFTVIRKVGGVVEPQGLAAGSPIRQTAYFIPFKRYKELPFAVLGLIPL